MNLYKISQEIHTGYDIYDSAVVCAETEEQAKKIHPSIIQEDPYFHKFWDEEKQAFYEIEDGVKDFDVHKEWADHIKDVQIDCIGKAKEFLEMGVIVASYNAG